MRKRFCIFKAFFLLKHPTSNQNLSESLCLLGFERGGVFANTPPTLHQHPTKFSFQRFRLLLQGQPYNTTDYYDSYTQIPVFSGLIPDEPSYYGWGVGWVFGVVLEDTQPCFKPCVQRRSERFGWGGGVFESKSCCGLSIPA